MTLIDTKRESHSIKNCYILLTECFSFSLNHLIHLSCTDEPTSQMKITLLPTSLVCPRFLSTKTAVFTSCVEMLLTTIKGKEK